MLKTYYLFPIKLLLCLFFIGAGTMRQVPDPTQYFVDVSEERLPGNSEFTMDVDLADVDGDSDLDVFFTNGARYSPYLAHQSRLYINDGRGYFTDETTERLPTENIDTRSSTFADFNGDGHPDVIISTASGYSCRLWINDGSGKFSDESLWRLPPILGAVFAGNPSVADFDADGDFDIILPSNNVNTPCPHSFLISSFRSALFNGSLSTRPIISPLFVPLLEQCIIACPNHSETACGEFEPYSNTYNPSRILINNGKGFFSDETESRLPGSEIDNDWTTGFLVIDFDLDGDLDIFEANRSERNRLLVNNGSGIFTDESNGRIPIDNVTSSVGRPCDFDNNGYLDIVLSTNPFERDRLLMNNAGQFVDETSGRFPDLSTSSGYSDAGDIDNDDWSDVIIVNSYKTQPLQNLLYHNTGGGYFTDVTDERLPVVDTQTRRVSFGDIDGDCDIDILLANCEEPNQVYLNVGIPDSHPPKIFSTGIEESSKIEDGEIQIYAHVIDHVSVNPGEVATRLFYSTDDGNHYHDCTMSWRGGELYSARILGLDPDTEIRYYFRAVDRSGNVCTDPRDVIMDSSRSNVYRVTLPPQRYSYLHDQP